MAERNGGSMREKRVRRVRAWALVDGDEFYEARSTEIGMRARNGILLSWGLKVVPCVITFPKKLRRAGK